MAFSLASFIAAALALFIAFSLDLPRPWWALMTVYVTTQPLSGALRPKVVYRLLGVLMGAAIAVLLVPALVNTPALLSLALASWIGLCLYFAVLDRTPRAFIFMLAGYTAAIVGFPYEDQPGDIFAVALARVEEMAISIVCAIAVHNLLLPWDVAKELSERASTFLQDAGDWVADALRGAHGFREDRERQRLAADVSELGILAVHLPEETLEVGATRRLVWTLEDRLTLVLPLASAAEDRLDALRARRAVSAGLAQLIEDVVDWLSRGPETAGSAASKLRERCREIAPSMDGPAEWDELLTASLCERLADFVSAFDDSRKLALGLRAPGGKPTEPLVLRRAPRTLHREYGLAALSGLASCAAVLAYCTIWILWAWPEGSATAAFAAIVSCSFVAQDDPAPGIVRYLAFTVATLPVSALYLFAILPVVDGFPMLVAALAPALLIMGYVQATPAWSGRALPMLACFIVALGFQQRYAADFDRFLNVSLAQIGGIVVTMGATRLFRSVAAAWTARRILRQGWADLALLAAARRAGDEKTWTNRMLDRVSLVTPRLALAEPSEQLKASDALNDLRIGRNIIHLQRARAAADAPAARRKLENVLSELVRFFEEQRRHGAALVPPHGLLTAIDEALSRLSEAAPGELRRQGFLALAGMRRNLFPRAAPYVGA